METLLRHCPLTPGRGRLLSAALLVLAFSTPTLLGQTHTDSIHGFQIKPPKGYAALALKPNQSNPIAHFQSEKKDTAPGASFSSLFEVHFYPASSYSKRMTAEEFMELRWERLETQFGYCEVLREKKVKVGRAPAIEKQFDPESDRLNLHATVLEQDDGIFVFKGIALREKFKKYSKDFTKAVKSFKRIEKEDAEEREDALAQMSDQERFLQEQIDKLPKGWSHLQTKRYVFLFNADKRLVSELAKQVEVIRDTYEKLYPPDEPIDAISIIRVCDNRDTYFGYGGPEGSGGYWNYRDQELVIFDSSPRSEIHAVLNHEAFHQYIFYFYGQLSPHSWYNEGHGDYFCGADMTKTWRIKSFGNAPGGYARKETVKKAVREVLSGRSGATHLKDLLRFSQAEYYANGGMHYAQGWAVVHMLRESRSLLPEWERILPDYLDNLLAAREDVAKEFLERALQKAKLNGDPVEDVSTDPTDYFSEASLKKEGRIQDLAYEKTFSGWSDAQWDEFNDFYMEYVQSL